MFTRSHPSAEPPCQFKDGDLTRTKLIPEKKLLKEFIHSFEFTKMTRNTAFSVTPPDATRSVRGIAEKGHQYALYLHHSTLPNKDWCSAYVVKPGNYQDTVMFNDVPAGNYRVEWISPESGAILQTQTIKQTAPGNVTMTSPVYAVDVALRMKLVDNAAR